MTCRRLLFAVMIGLTWSGVSFAVVAPFGSEFQVNTYTTYPQTRADVCSSADGNFVVVWQSYYQDRDGYGVFGQRYSSNGGRLGTEFQVNTYTTNFQSFPSICCDAAGDFVVVWASNNQDGNNEGIFGQRFASDGDRVGEEFQVNTYTSEDQTHPAVCCDAAGDFVVSWQSFDQDGSDYGIFAQRFGSNGAFRGAEFQVNTYTPSIQQNSSLCCDARGNFTIVWESDDGQDGDGDGVFGQRFSSNGAFRGNEFQVNTYTTGHQDYPTICCDASGNFVVAWQKEYRDTEYTDIFTQRFTSTGKQRGTEFEVNTYTTDFQLNPDVCCGKDGSFTIVWDSKASRYGPSRVEARRYAPNGNPDSPEFQVTTYTSAAYPAIACDDDGRFVVVWGSFRFEGVEEDIFGKQFRVLTQLPTPVLSWIGLGAAAAGLFGFGRATLRRRKK